MRNTILLPLLFLTLACQPINGPDLPLTNTLAPTPSATAFSSGEYVYLTPTPGYPEQGFGPANFPVDINPLTGLSANPVVLDRRPIIVKVSNLPRNVRPQFGLSHADIIYEYYTEEGTTRFGAIYYSQEAEQVGSIRSARFFDEHLVRIYKGIFVFGSGDQRTLDRLYNSEYADRLIVEWEADCPALCRPDPVTDFLIGNTVAIRDYVHEQGISDERQDLSGMRFRLQTPDGGEAAQQAYIWYSAVIYNRWDYDSSTGRYTRYSDVENALNDHPEEYEELTDALTGEPIAVENVVVLLMPHEFYSVSPEVVEMQFSGSGPAYLFRDGSVYSLEWVRPAKDAVVYLSTLDGAVFPFKPGRTWFEVMGVNTIIQDDDGIWRFDMRFP